jgi:hypothetical protein
MKKGDRLDGRCTICSRTEVHIESIKDGKLTAFCWVCKTDHDGCVSNTADEVAEKWKNLDNRWTWWG